MAMISALRNIPLFRSLSDADLTTISQYLHEEYYPKGTVIFQEGDSGDTMYLVKTGQVAVVGSQVQNIVDYLGPGSFVGEIALLLDQPRTASLQVTLDAELWALSRNNFEKLITFRPAISREIMRQLSQRLVSATQGQTTAKPQRITALFGTTVVGTLCRAITQLLPETIGLLVLPPLQLEEDINLTPQRGVMLLGTANLSADTLAENLSYQIDVFRHLIICLPEQPTPLARKAIDLADVVVSHGSPPPWLQVDGKTSKHLAITEKPKDVARVARYLTNKRVGLALSSGGARNLAHIGALKVLMAEDIPIDLVSGTSGGAWFGACYCAGWQAEQFDDFVANIQKRIFRLANADFNFPPRTGLFKGRKARDHILANTIGVTTFEQLQTPLYVVAANIYTGKEVIFEEGSLLDAIRASLSIPVIFEPWYYQDNYLVDGGVVNPLPANILREKGADIIIGSSVVQSLQNSYSGPRDQMPHILKTVFNIVSAMESEVVQKQAANVDILIQHNVSARHTLDFEDAQAVVEHGQTMAYTMLPAIKTALGLT